MRARALVVLAIVAIVRAHVGPAVLVLRGDSFRAGVTGSTGCVLSDQPVRNQLKTLESIEQYLVAPLLAYFETVLVTGLVYRCEANLRIVEFFGGNASAAASVHVRETVRGAANVSQRTLFRMALSEAAARHPHAEFYLVTRLDQTFGEAIAPPTEAWSRSMLQPWGNGVADQIFGFGRAVVGAALEELAAHDVNVSAWTAAQAELTPRAWGDMQKFMQPEFEARQIPVGLLYPHRHGKGDCRSRAGSPLPYVDCWRCGAPFCLPGSTYCAQMGLKGPFKNSKGRLTECRRS